MFKRFLIASALVLSAVAVTAAETDQPAAKKPAKKAADTILLSFNLAGDNEATIEVVEKSDNVKPHAKMIPFRNKKPGRALGFNVVPAAKGATEVTLKLKVNGKGTYIISGVGVSGAKKGQNVWFSCSSLAVGDQTYVPQGKAKKIYFAKWRALTGSKGIAIEGEQELEIKATFEKVPAKTAARLTANAKKAAEKKKNK